eukprot:scaffold2663_cov79-Isochrysis_galbana.AAC.2
MAGESAGSVLVWAAPLLEQPALFRGGGQDHRFVRPIHLELNRHLARRLPLACGAGGGGERVEYRRNPGGAPEPGRARPHPPCYSDSSAAGWGYSRLRLFRAWAHPWRHSWFGTAGCCTFGRRRR